MTTFETPIGNVPKLGQDMHLVRWIRSADGWRSQTLLCTYRGSTAHECVILDRNVVGFELKESYHANSLKNVDRARAAAAQPTDAQMSFADAGGGAAWSGA